MKFVHILGNYSPSMAGSRKTCLNRLNREAEDNKLSRLTARLCVTKFLTQNGDYKNNLYVGFDGKNAHLQNTENNKLYNRDFTLCQVLQELIHN